MNIGLIQLRFDILTVIIVCFVLIEVSLIIYSAYFREAEHSEAPVSVFPIRISSVFLSISMCVCVLNMSVCKIFRTHKDKSHTKSMRF